MTALAAESRAVHRTQGVPDSLLRGASDTTHVVSLARITSRASDSLPVTAARLLFDGIDTTFARLGRGAPDTVSRIIAVIAALADSARDQVDLRNPRDVVRHVARAARLASWVRGRIARCLHPGRGRVALRLGSSNVRSTRAARCRCGDGPRAAACL